MMPGGTSKMFIARSKVAADAYLADEAKQRKRYAEARKRRQERRRRMVAAIRHALGAVGRFLSRPVHRTSDD